MTKWIVKFQRNNTKLNILFAENKHTQRKLLYFVNRHTVDSSKIRHQFNKYRKLGENLVHVAVECPIFTLMIFRSIYDIWYFLLQEHTKLFYLAKESYEDENWSVSTLQVLSMFFYPYFIHILSIFCPYFVRILPWYFSRFNPDFS